jgi:oligogalacturonide lyase
MCSRVKYRHETAPISLASFGDIQLSSATMRVLTALLPFACLAVSGFANGEPPKEWIEPETGHRVIRISTAARQGSLYFHQNQFTASGDKMVLLTSNGVSVANLKTREVSPLVTGRVGNVVVGAKSRQVYYRTTNDLVMVTHMDTGATREIAKLPADIRRPSGFALNADETLLAGSFVEGGRRALPPGKENAEQAEAQRQQPPLEKSNVFGSLEERWQARQPMRLVTIHTKSGEIKTLHPSTNWLNHVQFSPTDPNLIMFCHEGPWHKVDRIWTIRTDGTGLTQIHKRTMDMEIAGHEFFSHDGKMIWYDLQTPRSKVFWLAGYNLKTGETTKYSVEREQWSVHYNVSPDGKLFLGDGGGPKSVAAPGNGMWMYLFRQKDGKLEAERLVDLSKHDYDLEPNGQFTPDGKWIVFRANMQGDAHTYMVEVAKVKP